MRRFELIALGARSGFPRRDAGRLRFSLAAATVAVLWTIVLAASAIPAAVQARTARSTARDQQTPAGADVRPGVLAESWQDVGGRLVHIRSVADADEVAAPPGVARLPGPGRSVLSPALARLVETQPEASFASWFGTVIGEIDPAGLVGPSELVAYVGVRREQLPDPRAAVTAGAPVAAELRGFAGAGTAMPNVAAWTWVAVIMMLLGAPMAVALAASVRLNATVRARRIASLRLLGMSPRDCSIVCLGELFVPASLGMAVGTLAFVVGGRAMAARGVVGRTWFASDVALSAATVLVGSAFVAVIAAMSLVGVRSAVASPLVGRRDPVAPSPARLP